jgi:hypothetical protein
MVNSFIENKIDLVLMIFDRHVTNYKNKKWEQLVRSAKPGDIYKKQKSILYYYRRW